MSNQDTISITTLARIFKDLPAYAVEEVYTALIDKAGECVARECRGCTACQDGPTLAAAISEQTGFSPADLSMGLYNHVTAGGACRRCSFFEWGDRPDCNAPDGPRLDYWVGNCDTDIHPRCPLREGPIVVTLD